MSPPIISVENLSKRYLVGHRKNRSEQGSYVALRDVLAQEMQNAARKISDVMHGRQVVQGDTLEEFWALRDVSFEVRRGEVLGIIGRNGAGKSTLLKLLSRITEPTRGRITLHGRVASLLEVGTGFHPELTGRENIFLNGAILGMSRAEIRQKFDEIVSFAEVERFLDTPVKRYSSGMYVRLAFAVAAHLDPEILIVDEVLAVGDAEFQRKCLGKIDEVARRSGRTVLVVSHNMGVVKSLCSRAIWLEDGAVRETGEPQELVDHYSARGATSGLKRVVSLEICKRPTWVRDERLRFTSLEWLSSLPLRHGEPAAIRLQLEVRTPISGVGIIIGFNSAEGVRVLTYHMGAAEARRDLLQPGRYSVDLYVDALNLGPSRYTLDVACRSGDILSLDSVRGIEIEILAGPSTPASFAENSSGMCLQGDWAWDNVARPQTAAAL